MKNVLLLITVLVLTGCQNKEMSKPLPEFNEILCKDSCYLDPWEPVPSAACNEFCHRRELLKEELLKQGK